MNLTAQIDQLGLKSDDCSDESVQDVLHLELASQLVGRLDHLPQKRSRHLEFFGQLIKGTLQRQLTHGAGVFRNATTSVRRRAANAARTARVPA